MPTTTLTSMQLRRSTFRGLSAAVKLGPVIITTYGKPTHALLTVEEYRKLIASETPAPASEAREPASERASEIGQGFSPGISAHKKSGL
jgi:PHD/YefM family antitoxin component YafN of YafNO toxin-antitoxin module